MTDDAFDLRLRDASQRLVSETIPRSVVIDAGFLRGELPVQRDIGSIIAGSVALLAAGLVVGLVVMSVLPPIGTRQTPNPSVDDVALAAAAGGPLVRTADGPVFVRRSADGHLELVLQKDAATQIVLSEVVESAPSPIEAFSSVHLLNCPASSGLAQQFYAFGQFNHSSTVTLENVSGVASPIKRDMYVIALDAASLPTGEWRFTTENGAGGSHSAAMRDLPSTGYLTAAGCYAQDH